MLGTQRIKVKGVVPNMSRFIYLSDSGSRQVFFKNLSKIRLFPLLINYCPLKSFLYISFFLLIASELAKTPRKNVSFSLKNDPEITINIPQCSKGKSLP